MGTQIRQWGTAKWKNWRAESPEEQWAWLRTLNLFPRRRPVLGSPEDLGGVKKEEDLPDRIDGEEERDSDLAYRTKEPWLTPHGGSETSKMRKTMRSRRVESNDDVVEVGNIGKFEIRLSWREEGQIRSCHRKSSTIECNPAAKTTVHVQQ